MNDDTFEAGYQAAIADLRWLAGARNNYSGDAVESQVKTVLNVADIIDGANDGTGWLPSRLWDEWDKIKRYAS